MICDCDLQMLMCSILLLDHCSPILQKSLSSRALSAACPEAGSSETGPSAACRCQCAGGHCCAAGVGVAGPSKRTPAA